MFIILMNGLREWSSDKVSVTVSELSVYFPYIIRCYAPNFEKVDGAYCFWSVRGCVRACVRACVRGWVTLFVPTVTFKPLKLES